MSFCSVVNTLYTYISQVTKNMTPGESVYGEKRISVEGPSSASGPGSNDAEPNGAIAAPTKTEYRVWNPFRSKAAAAILGGIDEIGIRPGAKVLYLV